MTAESLPGDAFCLSGLFSAQECADLISRAETIGFKPATVRTAAGPAMITGIRNNDRVDICDETLAEVMWSRCREMLPELDQQRAAGVDADLRFYRYQPGQRFNRHRDGAVTNQVGDTSKLSYLIYLNDDFEGGSTTLFEPTETGSGKRFRECGVKPATGMALFFRHEQWHEGAPVSHSCKYVLRSDVFYRHTKAT